MEGVLCIDKEAGFTSFDVVAKLRGITHIRRIGHAGTLDPMATGVLPVFFGRATKCCDICPDQDKRYTATFRLGFNTDTQDITGQVVREREVLVDKTQVWEAIQCFLGEIWQTPPMYSAVKVGGQKLYQLARQGIEVERPARKITIYQINLLESKGQTHTYTIDVFCSKGTYIRTLCEDIGEKLGCGAVLTELRRTQAAGYTLNDCITLKQAEELFKEGLLASQLKPVGSVFRSLPAVLLDSNQTKMFQNGVKLPLSQIKAPVENGDVRVLGNDESFLGVATVFPNEGILRLKKLFALGGTDS